MQELKSIVGALALAAILFLPPATAGGEIAIGGIEVVIRDTRADACDSPVAGFCLVGVDASDSPGDAEVDVYQEFRSVEVHVAPHLVDAPGTALLVEGEDVQVRHPVFRLATEAWASAPVDYPGRDTAGLRMTSRVVEVYYFGPSLADPLRPPGSTATGLEYAGGFSYDRLGPFNAPTGGETDATWRGLPGLLCTWGLGESECKAVAKDGSDTLLDATPNVRGGVQVYDLALQTGDGSTHARGDHGHEGSAVPLPKRPPAPYAPPLRAASPVPLPAAADAPTPAPFAQPRTGGGEAYPPGVETAGGAITLRDEARVPLVALASAGVALGLLVAALYTRLVRSRVVDQSTRNRVHAAIQKAPGTSVSILARELGLSRTTVRHHVNVLAEHALIGQRRVGRELLLFPLAAPPGDVNLALLGRSSARRKVAVAVVSGVGTQRELQEATGLSQRLVSYHLDHLRRLGFVQEADSWPRTYAATDTLRGIVPPDARGRVEGATS